MKTNVLIVGKGLSGVLLSVLLERKGIKTLLLSNSSEKKGLALSETISPNTLELIAQCGLLSIFDNSSSKLYGQETLWNNQLTDQNFSSKSSFKYGYKIDKYNLLKRLEHEIPNQILNYDFLTRVHLDTKFIATTIQKGFLKTTIQSDLIIDATGRNRSVLKHLGIVSVNEDDTTAFVSYIPTTGPQLKYGFFTESFKNGWGTISDLDETTRILTLFTSKLNYRFQSFRSYKNWESLLTTSKILKACLPSKGRYLVTQKEACSSLPLYVSGKRWLAIGDAAMAFNPILSHGISNAIYSAKEAKEGIVNYFENGKKTDFRNYEIALLNIVKGYKKQKEKLFEGVLK